MKKFTVWMLLSFLFVVNIYGQTDSLSFNNGYLINDRSLDVKEVKELMLKNKEALRSYNFGRTMGVVSYIFVYSSSYVLGYDLGTRIGGGDGSNTALLASGVGIAVGVLIGFVAENRYKHSVTLYNARLREEVSSLCFGLTDSGNIGFMLRL